LTKLLVVERGVRRLDPYSPKDLRTGPGFILGTF
jgi:hypothetical protein